MKEVQGNIVNSGATFSPCRKYRYALWRIWGKGPLLIAICLNPSTADEIENDPTVTRMIERARRWGYAGFIMLNLFAWRSTDPDGLLGLADAIGPENDEVISQYCMTASTIICAWGSASPLVSSRARDVVDMLKSFGVKLHYLKMGKKQPWHPLYLSYKLTPVEWAV